MKCLKKKMHSIHDIYEICLGHTSFLEGKKGYIFMDFYVTHPHANSGDSKASKWQLTHLQYHCITYLRVISHSIGTLKNYVTVNNKIKTPQIKCPPLLFLLGRHFLPRRINFLTQKNHLYPKESMFYPEESTMILHLGQSDCHLFVFKTILYVGTVNHNWSQE